MPRYAVLLRGINVGGHKKIAMADLRTLLAELGFGDVATLLQSGNAVVSSRLPAAKVAAVIEQGIADRFAMSVRCLVLTAAQLQAVIAAHPLAAVADNGSRMFAHFVFDPGLSAVDAALDPAADPAALDPGNIVVGDGVVYQWCPVGLLEAPDVSKFLARSAKATVTSRNWNTVTKLAALAG